MYYSYSSFEKAVNAKSTCRLIVSSWNGGFLGIGNGAHTWFNVKIHANLFQTYNMDYFSFAEKTKLSELNSGGAFIAGILI